MRPSNRSPFSDGSPEDEKDWEEIVTLRRVENTSEMAVKKIIAYLDEQIKVLTIESRRYYAGGDMARWKEAAHKRNWAEGMKIWVNHNV